MLLLYYIILFTLEPFIFFFVSHNCITVIVTYVTNVTPPQSHCVTVTLYLSSKYKIKKGKIKLKNKIKENKKMRIKTKKNKIKPSPLFTILTQKNMARYYNRYYIFTFIFKSSNKIYLDFIYIYTIYSLAKLVYWNLKLYSIEK